MCKRKQKLESSSVARGFLKSTWRFSTRGDRLADERNEPREPSVHLKRSIVYTRGSSCIPFRTWNCNTPLINKHFATIPTSISLLHRLRRRVSEYIRNWLLKTRIWRWKRVQYGRPSAHTERVNLLPSDSVHATYVFHPILCHTVIITLLPSLRHAFDLRYHGNDPTIINYPFVLFDPSLNQFVLLRGSEFARLYQDRLTP